MFSPIPDELAVMESGDEAAPDSVDRRSLQHTVIVGEQSNRIVRGIASMLAVSGVVVALGIATGRTDGRSEWTAGHDILLDNDRKDENISAIPKGCCSWAPHVECGKTLGKCIGGINECELCKGEWISLPQDICQQGHTLEHPLPKIWNYSGISQTFTSVKVLSYNLFWWHLYDKTHQGWRPGKLIKESAGSEPYDIMGFQECNYAPQPLSDAGLGDQYETYHTTVNTCIAVRKELWEVLAHGEHIVANDKGKQNYGQRVGMWVRIRHKKTNQTVFFVNHHGPLPLSSGGLWGGATTASKLLNLIRRNATKDDDAAILVGDFNSDAQSVTVRQIGCGLRRVISGNVFGGVDHIFSNLDASRVISSELLGKGGSDHDALSAVFKLKPTHEYVEERVLQQESRWVSWK